MQARKERREFRREQRVVALAMAGALAVTIATLGIVALLNRAATPSSFPVRLQSAFRVDLFVVGWLAASIGNVARLRFFSERDIAGSYAGSGSDEVRQAVAVLQNTLEQVSLAIVAHMVVAAIFDYSTALITALACLFAVGRIFFWAGYKHGAKGRAFGFALTFYPSVVVLIASALVTLSSVARG